MSLVGSRKENLISDDEISFYNNLFLKMPKINVTDDFIAHSSTEEILRKAIGNSFGAATGEGAFNTIIHNAVDENGRSVVDKTKEKCFDILLSELDSFSGTEQDYREWHTKVLIRLTESLSWIHDKKGNPAWTFGNSQKILNLMCKYIWAIDKRLKELGRVTCDFVRFAKHFVEVERDMDIPIDSFILEAICNYSIQNKLAFPIPAVNGGSYQGKYDSFKIKPWSTWNLNDYGTFCEKLHSYYEYPLSWEGYAWTSVKIDRWYQNAIKNMNKGDVKKAKNFLTKLGS